MGVHAAEINGPVEFADQTILIQQAREESPPDPQLHGFRAQWRLARVNVLSQWLLPFAGRNATISHIASPALGGQLARDIRTGTFCVHTPDVPSP